MSMTAPNKMMHKMMGTEGGKDSICVREFMADKFVNVCQVSLVSGVRCQVSLVLVLGTAPLPQVEDVITTRTYTRKE